MKLVGRTTCLYCEIDGVETPLVSAYGRPSCPIHSKAFVDSYNELIASIRAPSLSFDPRDPVGRPTVNGVTS